MIYLLSVRRSRSARLRLIAIVEDDFWSRPDRRKQKRDKNNPSDLSSWNDASNRFYKHLPQDRPVNLKDIETTLERWNRGAKSYKSAVSVFKKLARVANKDSIVEALSKLDVTQTEFRELQSATLPSQKQLKLKALSWVGDNLAENEVLVFDAGAHRA